MRFRLGRKNVGMHKKAFLTFFCFIAIQSLNSQTDGLKSLRLRAKQQLTSTTPSTATPRHPSSELTTISLSPNPSNPTSPLPQSRRRIRMRKLRKVQKRQGPLSSEETDNTNENQGPREPLYQEHEDEIQAPEHYYSPIRRQRMRSQKLFTQSHNVPQQFHKSLVESPSNQNIRKRERERNYFENLNNGGQHEEYSQSTQPPPKNYAFAYAVRDDENKEDNHFSHKEARDGQLTMGEYRINLPDGRVQVVRYTAGGDIGYKADVTYEGEGDDHPSKPALTAKPTAYTAGNNGYLPPSLSPPTNSPSPKKFRNRIKKKQNNRYQNFRSPTLSPTSAYNNRVEEYDSHEGFYSNIPPTSPSPSAAPSYKRPRPSVTYESYPIQPPATPPSPNAYSSSSNDEGERNRERRRRPSPTPNYERPKPTSIYDNMESAEKKEYDGNLEFLHDQSPRAGPSSSRPKKKKKVDEFNGGGYHRGSGGRTKYESADIGGYGYPGHPEIEEEIDTLKKSHKPQPNYQKHLQFKQRRKSPSRKPTESSPPELYNEPGPGNYYASAVNGPPPSPAPAPPQFRKHPKSVYRSPSTQSQSSYNYIDDHADRQPEQEEHHSYREQGDVDHDRRPPSSYGGYTPINFKSGKSKSLIPIEDFKAGPAKKDFHTRNKNIQKNQRKSPQVQVVDDFYSDPPTKHPQDLGYTEPYHYYNSQHPSYHHGGYIPPTPPAGLNQRLSTVASSPSPSPATSYTIDFPGGKHSFYLKTGAGSSSTPAPKFKSSSPFKQQKFYDKPQPTFQSPTSSPRKKSPGNGSGLVFFETPGTGPRPSHRGANDILSQLPNMPKSHPTSFPNTIIHPYEVGAKDYGHSVGYRNSFNTPSSGEKDEQDDNSHNEQQDSEDGKSNNPHETSPLSRDYLFDNGQEIVASPDPSHHFRTSSLVSSTPTPAQFHHEKALSPSPPSFYIPVSTPQSFQDIDYQQNHQLAPVSPTPAFSTSHFHQRIRQPVDLTSGTDYGIDPRNAGGDTIMSQPLGFTTISEAIDDNASQVQQHPADLTYQYQYEDGVK